MTLIGELYRPDLALLPIGDHYTMGPLHAVRACRMLGVEHVVPMHFGTFAALIQSADSFAEAAANIDGLTVHALEPGETLK
jgi:L-ascorbate metabolism protein UlaG (beta-lactamase superfamily)